MYFRIITIESTEFACTCCKIIIHILWKLQVRKKQNAISYFKSKLKLVKKNWYLHPDPEYILEFQRKWSHFLSLAILVTNRTLQFSKYHKHNDKCVIKIYLNIKKKNIKDVYKENMVTEVKQINLFDRCYNSNVNLNYWRCVTTGAWGKDPAPLPRSCPQGPVSVRTWWWAMTLLLASSNRRSSSSP